MLDLAAFAPTTPRTLEPGGIFAPEADAQISVPFFLPEADAQIPIPFFSLDADAQIPIPSSVTATDAQIPIPSSVTAAPIDQNGLPVPPPYGSADGFISKAWTALPGQYRSRRSREWVECEIAKASKAESAKPPRRHTPATRFSTRQAIDWGKARGWTVISVEEDRAYQKDGKWVRRTADQKFGMDVVFRAPGIGVVGVQAAGKSERKSHWETFIGLGGPSRAHTVYDQCWYIEFERGVAEPTKAERWI